MREQGISKAGNQRVRALAVEIAWAWLRFQPQSKLSQWYMKRFASGGKRMRRIGIVAVARRLLIDLWRYLEYDKIPEGARISAGCSTSYRFHRWIVFINRFSEAYFERIQH